jgi:Cu/Ag efflux pump CusA
MEDFPGIALTFTQPIDMRVSEMLTGVRGDLAIKLYGTGPAHPEPPGQRDRERG